MGHFLCSVDDSLIDVLSSHTAAVVFSSAKDTEHKIRKFEILINQSQRAMQGRGGPAHTLV